ncbi:serine O-acetyltransferase [Natronoarchaeum philippinense]|uniref:Serine acetyltransferase n=1 Tax=Natronoarchaeum philippinense TaxID=558529 RepID=A0A285N8M5_NATPI|nr:serine O-acetyltransferase [Natronoarchaeum philippinense]
MLDRVREDVRTALENDPAARSRREVLTSYPGLHAVWLHRVAHALWNRGLTWPARLLSHLSRFLTGVEIHPAATIGRRCFIDHGAGVVIGETAEVGDDVHMHHGCTLGGNSPRPEKRHPTLEDGVTLGADATLVGDITIGEGATVGAGAVVVDDVPPETTVMGVPAEPVETGAATADSIADADSDAEADPPDDADRSADIEQPDDAEPEAARAATAACGDAGRGGTVALLEERDAEEPDPDELLDAIDAALADAEARQRELRELREDVERLTDR